MILIQTAAFAALAFAAFFRLETWARTQSRPMTLALATAALYAVLGYPFVNTLFNDAVRDIYGWNNLPQLASSLLFLLSAEFLGRHILNAMDREDLAPALRTLTGCALLFVLASYALTEAPFLDSMPRAGTTGTAVHWLTLSIVSCVINGAMLTCAFQSYGESGKERMVLMVYQFAAGIGLLAAAKQTVEVATPINFGVDGNQQLLYVALIGYAWAAILNHRFKRAQPHPEREVINGMGGTAPIR